jgi:bifunctional isochorismate lyase/aryl carrier protein
MTIPRIAEYPLPESAGWPKNKVEWHLEKRMSVLLIHDMQRHFLDFYGKEDRSLKQVIANISLLLASARQHKIPVIYTAQKGDQDQVARGLLCDFWGPGMKEVGTPIISEIGPIQGELIFEKHRYSAFFGNGLLEHMKALGRSQMLICGVYAHIGCTLTAADAFMNGIQTFMVGDGVYDFSFDSHQTALTYVASLCGKIVTTESAINAL